MPELSLELFTEVAKLSQSTKFSDVGIFDLLGKKLHNFITSWLATVDCHDAPKILGEVHPSAVLEGPIYVAKGAVVGPGAYITGPCFLDDGAEVRHTAYIRGPSYVGPGAVVGHATEVKASEGAPVAAMTLWRRFEVALRLRHARLFQQSMPTWTMESKAGRSEIVTQISSENSPQRRQRQDTLPSSPPRGEGT